MIKLRLLFAICTVLLIGAVLSQAGFVRAAPTTAGTITQHVIPTIEAEPFGITLGPDGNLWFTESNGNKIGRLFYYFYLRPEGTFGLRCNMDRQYRQLTEGYSPAIHAGYNCANTLAVVADGATIPLYANQQLLATVTDYTYQAGRIGTAIAVSDSPPGDAAFRNVMLWTL